MPLYEYELCEGDCVVCGGKFTSAPAAVRSAVTKCPACEEAGPPGVVQLHSPKTLSVSDAKKAGFTVLKRVGKGEYERQ